MAAKFVLKKGSTGKFRFNLLATNGKVIATSEAYETKRAALGGIESVKSNAGDAAVDDLTGGRKSVKPTNEKATARAADEPRVVGGSRDDESRDDESRDEATLDDIMTGDDGTSDESESATDRDQHTGDDTSDDDAPRDEDSGDGEGGDDESDATRPMAPPVDQSPAMRNDGTLNLGLCHFGGAEEPASVLATRTDGTGWIAVCEEHTKDAEKQGYVIEQSQEDAKADG